jgi:hypothetical protein
MILAKSTEKFGRWIDQSVSANNQSFSVKNTQQKSSATFLPFFEKSAKRTAAVSSGR